ncbi:hypothetical protein HYFRA_00012162 [Hymenoscyphus fraxineus]|uniref:Uncharacterized protein n=1 Tax=Hymenoscyphus fraxineus TaxID=746836 RepID=A0A9N9PXL4_9HELO|nr:hypothetical protein HYFRA_00012162 [Hymenoscyphus fraxineus]
MASHDQILHKVAPPSNYAPSEPRYPLLDSPGLTPIEKGPSTDLRDGNSKIRFSSESVFSRNGKPSEKQRYPTFPAETHGHQYMSSQFWWKPIFWMVTCIWLGIAAGLGHHFGYQSLHRQPQEILSQTWSHNLGLGAAFFVKTCFTLAVLASLQEVLWFTFRQKAIKIALMDKLFTLTSNPLSFGSGAFIHAPLATSLAAAAWIIPISAILSPGSLTVGPLILHNDTTCVVPIFAAASPNISFYRLVPHGSTIQGPNSGIQKVAGQTFAQGTILWSSSPCGPNCTFETSFLGPGLDCQPIPSPSYLDENGGQKAMWLFYNATSDYDDENSAMALSITYRNTSKGEASTSPLSPPYVSLRCLAYSATYNVLVNYTNGLSKFTTKLTNNGPLLNLNSTESRARGNPWRINSAALVQEVFDDYLNGTWQKSPTTQYAAPSTSITETTLAGDTNDANYGTASSLWFINRDLGAGIPELLTNLTLSTLAFSPMNTTTTCSASTEILAYYYNPKLLLIPYSVALLLSLIALAAGVWVLRRTGMPTGQIFSQILVTTRNPLLDELARGSSLSSADAEALMQQKLMFGELKHNEHDTRTGHAAFGPAEQLFKLTGGKI